MLEWVEMHAALIAMTLALILLCHGAIWLWQKTFKSGRKWLI
jgi:hypothetical protein